MKKEPDDSIMGILQNNGVQYVHMNDAILEPSKAEEIVCAFPLIATVAKRDTQVLEDFKKKAKRKQRSNKTRFYGEDSGKAGESDSVWPPNRPKKPRAPA